MVKLNPDIFIGCNGQDVVMAKFNKFLLDVPNGEKIQIEPKTMTVLNEIGQALGSLDHAGDRRARHGACGSGRHPRRAGCSR